MFVIFVLLVSLLLISWLISFSDIRKLICDFHNGYASLLLLAADLKVYIYIHLFVNKVFGASVDILLFSLSTVKTNRQ